MRKIDLQSLIDRVIGKEGILRVPAYWMRRVLYNLMEFSEKTAESQAKKALTDAKTYAKTYADASKEYTDQQISGLGLTGREPILYVLPEDTIQGVPLYEDYEFTYNFTTAEAEEFLNVISNGIDNIIFVYGRKDSILIPRGVALQVMKIGNSIGLVGFQRLGKQDGEWMTWDIILYIDYDTDSRSVSCRLHCEREVLPISAS